MHTLGFTFVFNGSLCMCFDWLLFSFERKKGVRVGGGHLRSVWAEKSVTRIYDVNKISVYVHTHTHCNDSVKFNSEKQSLTLFQSCVYSKFPS